MKRYFLDTSIYNLEFDKKAIRKLEGLEIKNIEDIIAFDLDLGKKLSEEIRDRIVEIKEAANKATQELYIEKEKTRRECFPELMFSIKKLNFPEKSEKILLENGIIYVADICQFAMEDFAFAGIGKKKMEELYQILVEKKMQRAFEYTHQDRVGENLYKTILGLLEECKIEIDRDGIIYELAKVVNEGNLIQEIKAEDFYKRSEIEKIFKEAILKNVTEFTEVSLWTEERYFPDVLRLSGYIKKLIDDLIKEGSLSLEEGIIKRIYPTITKYIATIEDPKIKQILEERIAGNTLEEIAVHIDLTKERVRQIMSKILDDIPRLDEHKYEHIYTTYSFTLEEFQELYCEDEKVYRFLEIYYGKYGRIKKKKNLEDMLDDEAVSWVVKRKVEEKKYKDYILLENHYIKKERGEILEYAIKKFAKDPLVIDEFREKYIDLLKGLGLEEDPNFELTKGIFNRISDSHSVLWSLGRTIRYYPINPKDFVEFLAELKLEKFKDVEISTLKLYRDHEELMRDYDIRSEYELHNLLKKLNLEETIPDIAFPRMPMIKFGDANKDKQLEELMFELAPIKPVDLAEEFEKLYGIAKNTVIGTLSKSISEHLYKGIYVVDYEIAPQEILDKLKKVITEDYYAIEDLKSIYESTNLDEKGKYFNPGTLGKIGYKCYSGYVVKDTYQTTSQYFEQLIKNLDRFELAELPNKIEQILQFRIILKEYLSNYDFVEFEKNKFMSIKVLEGLGITKEAFKQYCNDVYKNVEEKYFTLTSIRDPQISDLHNLELKNDFFISLLKQQKEMFSYRRLGHTILFKKDGGEVEFAEFVDEVIRKEELLGIDIDYLVKLLYSEYGMELDKWKVIEHIQRTKLYYSQALRKLYLDYASYQKENYII